jgi:hypothetical protein
MGLKGYRLWVMGQLNSTCRAPPRCSGAGLNYLKGTVLKPGLIFKGKDLPTSRFQAIGRQILKSGLIFKGKRVCQNQSTRSNRRLLQVVLSFCPLRCSFCVPVERPSEGKNLCPLVISFCLGRKTTEKNRWGRKCKKEKTRSVWHIRCR